MIAVISEMFCGCSHVSAHGHTGRSKVSYLLPFVSLPAYTVPVPQVMSRSSKLWLLLWSVPHWRCGTAGLRPAVSMVSERVGRFLSGGGFTHRVRGGLCSPPSMLSQILLEKRESSSDCGLTAPFALHGNAACLRQMARSGAV